MTGDEIKKKIEEVITIEGEREGNFVNYYFALANEQIDRLVDFVEAVYNIGYFDGQRDLSEAIAKEV